MNWTLAILLISAIVNAIAGCGLPRAPQQLRLRSTISEAPKEEPQLDLSQLSESQLQQLMQQLNLADLYEDHRGASRPWNKVQRIIRRQLVRIPKRYLKKLLRQFGLARSGTVHLEPETETETETEPLQQPQLYYLIPLE